MADSDGDGGRKNSAAYLTEDIVISILLRLPTASCIARFRCVCRYWRNLLSDPNFIGKILFFKNSADLETLQLLITGSEKATYPRLFHYSVNSYETLRPIAGHDSPSILTQINDGYGKVAACCDGIFCIVVQKLMRRGEDLNQSIVLWNPATSETKFLPPGPSHPTRVAQFTRNRALFPQEVHTGFGFDPRTNDYKVIRVLEFAERYTDDEGEYDYDPADVYHGAPPLVFTEVYSLRNDSWKTLNTNNHWIHGMVGCEARYLHLHQQSRNEKCYWFHDESPTGCAVISFDMSSEVFESVVFPRPPSIDRVVYDVGPRGSTYAVDYWLHKSSFMLKGAIIVTFSNMNPKLDVPDEIWGLLKFGVAESWTKLFTVPRDAYADHLEVWKDTTYICSRGGIFIRDLATGETIRDHLEIEGTHQLFGALAYVPTRVLLSDQLDTLEC